MKTFWNIWGITLLLVGQLWLTVVLTSFAGDTFKVAYRRAERYAAFKAMLADPSPENKAANKEEQRLVDRYLLERWLLKATMVMSGWLFIDGVVIYCWVHQGKRKPAA